MKEDYYYVEIQTNIYCPQIDGRKMAKILEFQIKKLLVGGVTDFYNNYKNA